MNIRVTRKKYVYTYISKYNLYMLAWYKQDLNQALLNWNMFARFPHFEQQFVITTTTRRNKLTQHIRKRYALPLMPSPSPTLRSPQTPKVNRKAPSFFLMNSKSLNKKLQISDEIIAVHIFYTKRLYCLNDLWVCVNFC